MPSEFSGIERRLDELSERLARLKPLQVKSRDEFSEDAYLRDIVERNPEVAAQCCIDLSHRIIAIEQAVKPRDYYEAILQMGELGVVPVSFARKLAVAKADFSKIRRRIRKYNIGLAQYPVNQVSA